VIACRGPSLGLFEVLERGLAPREGVDGAVVEQGVGAQRRRHTRGEPCSRVCMHSLGPHKRTTAGSGKNLATGCCWALPEQVEGRPEAWSEAEAGVYPRDEDKSHDCGRALNLSRQDQRRGRPDRRYSVRACPASGGRAVSLSDRIRGPDNPRFDSIGSE
jgi:hypothetical protein